MHQPLVVLTYPGHFLLTALTIKSFFQYSSQVPVTVIVDDISRYCWPTYVQDCEGFYQTLADSVTVIPVSRLPEAHTYNQPTNGWLRQQIVKLYLDKLVDYTVWFFTDGDMQFQFPIPYDSVPFTITNRRTDDIRDRQNFYVSKMLDIANPGIIAEHPHLDWTPDRRAQVCVSNPPFRTMQAETLRQLRQHIHNLRGQDLIQAHTWLYDTNEFTANGNAPFIESEWELIENFRVHVLKEDINPIYYPVVDLSPDNQYNKDGLEFCVTCYVSDKSLGRSWFEQQGLAVSDTVWQHLAEINK